MRSVYDYSLLRTHCSTLIMVTTKSTGSMSRRKNKPSRLLLWWARFWLRLSGISVGGRLATRMAGLFAPPYKARRYLARLSKRGYISPTASLGCCRLQLGEHIFVGDRVIVFDADGDGVLSIGNKSSVHQGGTIELGQGGSLAIGDNSHVQPRCQFSAYKGSIKIGNGVQIAPNCGFYPYNHGFASNSPIMDQPLQSKGGIVVGDDAWIGFGVVVLDGAHIGEGAIIGAGSVVKSTIPAGAIAVGVPAKVVRMRGEPAQLKNA